ncbi:DNA adenine methylase [Bacillus altitudinis]|uniref:DNA adenine methylase n=1 Tax=Bacillus altitudinis TaxID=293387 RepID=UPI002246C25B|nr:DNA adenine methylase [Bacillus altitudinis]KAJ0073366.1 DNA adenine methylase [Bacillus altitudinis]
MTRSPLIWFGGKAKYAELIINKMPGHKVYVEPFGGAAHVIAHKPKGGHEVYNDIDGNVVNFLMQVRKNPKAMQSACESIPYSRQLYEQWKAEDYPKDDFERAVRWFYMNRSGISKGNAENVPQTGWRHSTQTYYQDPLIEELYSDWHQETFAAYKQVVGSSEKDRYTEEMLLFNYEIKQLSLFD